jgi:large subunit ribosomal protein L24e
VSLIACRMIASKEKLRAHRRKAAEKSAVRLLEPISAESSKIKIKERIKVSRPKSALVAGEGRSMDMDID